MCRQRGDTIIEVLLAVTVFSMLAIGTMVIMNRGAAIAERSLEITLVRQQIDGQAEMLRYVHARYSAGDAHYTDMWTNKLPKSVGGSVEALGAGSCPATQPSQSFALYPSGSNKIAKTTEFYTAETYAKLDSNRARGIWVQLVKAQGSHAYDAYIQACWDGAGGQVQTTGTIVRLYDPKA
ncbi:MAG: type II secretion system protein [Candidatus Saccharibacteria bacterium]|nr:type II secretion system protein [Candidatus Saccharibacteria bacterium]